MQIDRLFQIVQILLSKEKVTAGALAERFQVSIRTIYRDVDTLSINGVPIYATKGKGGGIRLMESYTMDKSVLSDEERSGILLGLETLKATQAEDVDEVLRKFRDIFQHSGHEWIRVDFSHWGNDPKEKRKFQDMKRALTSHHSVTFNYYDAYSNYSKRHVYPIQLLFKEKAWYLIGYCTYKEAFRFFKLMRMADLTILEETFDPKAYPLKEDLLYDPPPLKGERFTFHVSKDARYRIYDDFPRENVTRLENGDFEVTYYGKEDAWLYGFIFSYGEHMTVMAPEGLRLRIKEKVSLMQKNYS